MGRKVAGHIGLELRTKRPSPQNGPAKVTVVLLLQGCTESESAVDIIDMKTRQGERSADQMRIITVRRLRASHFFSDRYAYREQPNYLPELVGFGIIVVAAAWPILLLVNAIASMR